MPAAIPIIATVAAGAAAANGAYAIAMAITIAAQVATQMMTKKPSLGSYRDTAERKQVLRAAASPKTVVYGRTVSAGTLFSLKNSPASRLMVNGFIWPLLWRDTPFQARAPFTLAMMISALMANRHL
jgi:hypothetical protein